jgi:hypothetical protein
LCPATPFCGADWIAAVSGTERRSVRPTFLAFSPVVHSCRPATLRVSSPSAVETTVPASESVYTLPAGTEKSSRWAACRYGYGSAAAFPPGCTSKCRWGWMPFASPESPTNPIVCPATTREPFLRPRAYDMPGTHLPRLSLPLPTSLFRWMYSYIVPLLP